MSKLIEFEKLSRKEQIEIIANQFNKEEQAEIIISCFSGHEGMLEVASIFAILTSYKIIGDDYVEYYDGLVDEEIEERINNAILNNNSEGILKEEEIAWNSIINALGIKTIFEIMDNWKKYVGRSIRIENLLSDTKKHLYTEFLLED